jgi:hypothetical protein
MQFYQQSAIADKQIKIAHLSYERIDTYVGALSWAFWWVVILPNVGFEMPFLKAQWRRQVSYDTLLKELDRCD